MNHQESLRLAIQGMHCGACVNRVTAAIGKLEGIRVHNVEVGSADLVYDPEVATPEQITAAVNRIGFTAGVAVE